MHPLMSSSLRDIPGAGKPGRRSRRDPLGPRKREGGMLRPAQPRALTAGNRRRKRAFGPRSERDPFNMVLGLCFVVLAVVGAVWLWNTNKVTISAAGVQDDATL